LFFAFYAVAWKKVKQNFYYSTNCRWHSGSTKIPVCMEY